MRENVLILIAALTAALIACETATTTDGREASPVRESDPTEKPKSTNDGGAPPIANPCGAVTVAGHCLSPSEFEACVTPTGGAKTQLIKKACTASETCSEVGRAHCEPNPGACRPGAERCTSADSMQFCQDHEPRANTDLAATRRSSRSRSCTSAANATDTRVSADPLCPGSRA